MGDFNDHPQTIGKIRMVNGEPKQAVCAFLGHHTAFTRLENG